MTRSDLTHIYFLLDRSGSMQSIKSDTEGGFATFVEEQKKAPGDCRVTLAQFDNEYEVVYSGVPVVDVPPLALQPRGTTEEALAGAADKISRLRSARRANPAAAMEAYTEAERSQLAD